MQQEDIIPLMGGLDLVTPAISKGPGYCIAAQNYESNDRGYGRIEGYERYDGQPSPSEASYWVLAFDSGSTEVTEGDTVTGATSGATGIALIDGILDSGTYGGGDAVGSLILYNVSGTFQDNEGLEVSASNVATADGEAIERGAADDTLDDTYWQSAIEKRRSLIMAVPGSGPIRGVARYKGSVYAWRDNAGATACDMHKSTNSGWQAQSFGDTLDFTAGSAAFTEGQTLTGGTSGATATIERVVLQSGAWSGTAAGYLVLSSVSGTFSAAETITDGGGGSATCSGAQAAITLPAGGKYRSIKNNFFGTSNLRRLYFVNGEGYAHEWDGTVLAPIRTGLSSSLDKPQFVGAHSNHLLLGFDGGAIMNSAIGNPLVYITTLGAGEFNIGANITGIKSSTKTATIITARNKVSYLTGTDSSNFVLSDIAEDSGAVADTLEVIGDVHFLDDLGVRSLRSAQTFGDWNQGTVTDLVEPLIREKRETGVSPVGAIRVRSKNQYRLFYDDASVISIYFGRKKPEAMPLMLDFTPNCATSGEDAVGNEILIAGADDGFVYEMDKGNSADGQEVEAFIRFPFAHHGDPNREKRYHRALISLAHGGPTTTLLYSSEYGYGDPELSAGVDDTIIMPGSGGFWDSSVWEEFYWDAAVQSEGYAELNGIGKNISISILSEAVYEEPHTLTSIAIYFTPRRKRR